MSIDTSRSICSVAILDEKNNIFYKENSLHNQHTKDLFSLIHSIFEESKNNYNSITDIAVVVGPGSFTGIRAGIAAAQGIQLTTNITVHGISTLEMQAYSIHKFIKNTDKPIKAIISTHHTIYTQIFTSNILPLTNISIVSNSDTHENSHITYKNIPEITINAKTAAMTLVHKINNKLPSLSLIPIYENTNFKKI
ncbi:tRNA (adenosine(37)-N6)-threonylcarbamoyltransferase complex dimerization subunit type 1 TsaB [Neoehrlichia mikurensis]|uniref:tRNA (Adenosine(37)-N6)-threonylcarbamoyltransferase complex dimerization subunit type 1 TsaB n=1 Tax=Neoehrlichia mikurensis TaxID=89586 RepID=A0A9Q9F3C9_9RICK|nr:tRNA (adenosine(37)-N6)-threonylcarbamoyltransferase complex dimerization subunit type 1 TsaB [Neoehrlichia mikurensis]UTO55309.1 tRNA (adenosine(37)-N6)-threonylcarbamoyltransferase complex dimerization subunit type 1 TsaB [Neoehrlichia mikurensis]UTO56229.1 tRNA (adenosine(37)-N6)-threonylcarbamoyltransferase complex dimerization subunit type 1 TsaB [Neoehrlichia mikurensis]